MTIKTGAMFINRNLPIINTNLYLKKTGIGYTL